MTKAEKGGEPTRPYQLARHCERFAYGLLANPTEALWKGACRALTKARILIRQRFSISYYLARRPIDCALHLWRGTKQHRWRPKDFRLSPRAPGNRPLQETR